MTRLQRLEERLTYHSQRVTDYDEDCEEDLRLFFSGEDELAEWMAVTDHNGKRFFYPTFDTQAEAEARAVQYIADDLYAEQPVEVFNLDTGERSYPVQFLVEWSDLD